MLSLKQILLCFLILLWGGLGNVTYANYMDPFSSQTPSSAYLQQMQNAQRAAVTPRLGNNNSGGGSWPSDWNDPFDNDDDEESWFPSDWDDPFHEQEESQFPEDWDDPFHTPVGDLPWAMVALLIAGGIVRIYTKQNTKEYE